MDIITYIKKRVVCYCGSMYSEGTIVGSEGFKNDNQNFSLISIGQCRIFNWIYIYISEGIIAEYQ